MGGLDQVLFIFECHLCSPFVVSLSNHEWTALRQAQGERKIDDKTKTKRPWGLDRGYGYGYWAFGCWG